MGRLKLPSWIWGDNESTESVDDKSPEKITLAAYNVLRENVTESAKHARNLFISHVGVNFYAIITVATIEDADFFVDNASIKLPVIDLRVSPGLYLPGVSLISIFIYLYFQFYMHNMWILVAKVRSYSSQHIKDEGYVPSDRVFRYPWIAFATNAESGWYRLIASVFTIFQWSLTPFLLFICWIKTDRLGGNWSHWFVGLPWPGFFLALFLALLFVFPFWYARYCGITGNPLKRRGKALSLLISCCCFFLAVKVNLVFLNHPLQLAYTEMRVIGKNLVNVNLDRANLYRANLEEANLIGANLLLAYLYRANLEGANLIGANLYRTNLEGALLTGANLYRANLEGANLTGANLEGAELVGTNLEEAVLTGALFKGAEYDSQTKFPKNFDYKNRLMRGPGANLRGADLKGAFLSYSDLEGANLREANFEGANLFGADLKGAHLEGANLREANFEGANLFGAHLERADFEGANLENVDFEGVDLKGANLGGARYNSQTKFPKNFDYENKLMRGPGTDLKGANLYGADLKRVNLQGADLREADLREADLREADLGGANLKGADLEGADLKGANLIRTNLEGADLVKANLEGADLEGANLAEVYLGGARYNSETKFPAGFDQKQHKMIQWRDRYMEK